MPYTKQDISVAQTNLFSNLFTDYINESNTLNPYFQNYFNELGFRKFLDKNKFDYLNRPVLVEVLQKQSQLVSNSTAKSQANILSLKQANTYTITTGHQLCLFTGPLYFIYKIISAINLCKTLKEKFPDNNFVPVYWMASEDHDFAEVNHANVFGKKITWHSEQKGSVGEFRTEELKDVIAELKTILGNNERSDKLIELFENAYLNHKCLADATRYIVNELFGNTGLVIIDGNDAKLKSLFKDEFKKDIFENCSFQLVSKTISELKEHYLTQVNPREINVFYKDRDLRERIEKQGDKFVVLNTSISFTKDELETLINTSPEKLSPNVVLRPVYQQKILPNIAYVGGPGELAYWLEYKTMFDDFAIHLPVLVPRHFIMLLDKGIQNKLQKLNLTPSDVFKDGEELVKQFIKTEHQNVTLEDYKLQLTSIYTEISEMVSKIDKTLEGTTEAEKQKSINGLLNIEQKINKSLKQKSESDVNQIWNIKTKLFPNAIPQERNDNFSMYYTKIDEDFISIMIKELQYNLPSVYYSIFILE